MSADAGTRSVDTATPSGDVLTRGEPGREIARTARQDPPVHARSGLPLVLMDTPHAHVVHGTDPGDYYCEHMFFSAQGAARAAGSSVRHNAHDELLVGFLHLPPDAHCDDADARPAQAERHQGTREVVGAALRGYHDAARAGGSDEPVRLLLTGYGRFGHVRNNPTEDFVAHRENLDAAMQQGFGELLVTPQGERVDGGEGWAHWRYQVRDPASGAAHEVLLRAQRFDVDDTAIDPAGPRSVQRAMQDFSPQAVLSMGVSGDARYLAEHHADSGGLELGDRPRHLWSAPATTTHPDNFSLARAIVDGQRAPRTVTPPLLALLGR